MRRQLSRLFGGREELLRIGSRLAYAPVLAVSLVIMMARLLVLARLLPLGEFGHLSQGLLVSGTFSMVGCLGLQFRLQRELPVLLLNGERRAGIVLTIQCILVTLGCALVGVACVIVGGATIKVSVLPLIVGIVHGRIQRLAVLGTEAILLIPYVQGGFLEGNGIHVSRHEFHHRIHSKSSSPVSPRSRRIPISATQDLVVRGREVNQAERSPSRSNGLTFRSLPGAGRWK